MGSQLHASGCRGLIPQGRKSVVRWRSKTLPPCCLGFSVGKIHGNDLAGLWLLRAATVLRDFGRTIFLCPDLQYQQCTQTQSFNLLHLSLQDVTVVALKSFSGAAPLCFGFTAHAAPTFSGLLSYYQWLPSAASCLVSSVGQRSSLYSLCTKCLVQREYIIATT